MMTQHWIRSFSRKCGPSCFPSVHRWLPISYVRLFDILPQRHTVLGTTVKEKEVKINADMKVSEQCVNWM